MCRIRESKDAARRAHRPFCVVVHRRRSPNNKDVLTARIHYYCEMSDVSFFTKEHFKLNFQGGSHGYFVLLRIKCSVKLTFGFGAGHDGKCSRGNENPCKANWMLADNDGGWPDCFWCRINFRGKFTEIEKVRAVLFFIVLNLSSAVVIEY